jgi:hypothetical protein
MLRGPNAPAPEWAIRASLTTELPDAGRMSAAAD